MGIFSDYKEYKKYEPQYAEWKNQKDLSEAKKLEYLKQNPVDEKEKQKEIQRGMALLNAVDVMDEYSQSRAENMEVATQSAVSSVAQISSYIGLGIGYLSTKIPFVAKQLDKIVSKYPKMCGFVNMIPIAISIVLLIIPTVFLQGWAAGKEVGASRQGRFQAMKDDLSDPKMFAVLTDEQKAKQAEIVKNIPTTKDMEKGIVAKKSSMLNPMNAFRTFKEMLMNNQKADEERKKFNDNLCEQKSDNVKLSESDILKAKKDQQLLTNIVEHIDIASQDYAEDTEMAVQGLVALSGIGGGISGLLTNKILKALKIVNTKASAIISMVVSAIVFLVPTIWGTQIQKQASRIGRFVAKKELMKNMNNFVYADKEKSDKISNNVKIEKKEKPNFFKFLYRLFKENNEYKQYLKTKGVELAKQKIALKDIKFSEEQMKDAKMLQKNSFKTFNKLDEKSQKYAESVEAVGQTLEAPVASVGPMAGLGIGTLICCMKSIPKALRMIAPSVCAILGIVPTLFIQWHFTKEQKKASKIAHMLALNEMKDYKTFVDYDNLSNNDTLVSKDNKTSRQNIIDDFLKQTSNPKSAA